MNTTPTANSSFYLETSLPHGMTISEYRRSRPSRQSRWERLKQLAGGTRVVAAASA
jgi:hypothetical protein